MGVKLSQDRCTSPEAPRALELEPYIPRGHCVPPRRQTTCRARSLSASPCYCVVREEIATQNVNELADVIEEASGNEAEGGEDVDEGNNNIIFSYHSFLRIFHICLYDLGEILDTE